MSFNFNQSLPASFKSPLIPTKTQFLDPSAQSLYQKTDFGVDTIGVFEDKSLAGLNAFGLNTQSQPAWTFITAPEDVSWDVANQANRVDMFGTNNPPVVAGSRGMRDLTLGNSLVEGFVRNVTVGGKISALEALMNYKLNQSDGFVSVPVYQVWASDRSYGGSEAYYIIRDIKIKETMRDLRGDTTRAFVDISLMQVPAFQVNSGRDQASKVTAGVKSSLLSQAQARATEQAQGKNPASAAAGAAANQTKPVAGPLSAKPGNQPATAGVKPVAPALGREIKL